MNTEEIIKALREMAKYPTVTLPRDSEALKAAADLLAQRKYRRGDRLICLETEEYCVIHISGTDRQWLKFPDTHIGVYTNEQVAELFELLPKEPEQLAQQYNATSDYQLMENAQGDLERIKLVQTGVGISKPEQEPVAWESLLGAVARGWCYEENANKTMDSDLAVAIAKEVQALYTTPPQRKEPEQEEYLSKAYRLANELRCHLAITPAPQRTWVGLTEEELQKILQEVSGQGWKPMLEAIEAKLKEKNNV